MIDRVHEIERRRIDGSQRRFRHHARAVDEHIDPPEPFGGRRDGFDDRLLASEVGGDPVRIALGRDRAVETDGHGPGFAKSEEDGTADAARRARDERAAAGEESHHGSSPRSTPSDWPVMLPDRLEARNR